MRTSLLNNKEVKNASWLIGGRVIQMSLSLLVGVLTARYLGPSNYGLIGYANAYVAFFTSLCTLGINSIIIRDFVDHPDEQGKTIGTTIVLRLISSMVSMIMIIAIVSILDKGEPITITVTTLCSFALIFQTFDTINYWFQSRYQSKITSLAMLFGYIVISVYKIALLILGKDVRWFAFASTLDFVCVATFLIAVYRKNEGPRFSFSWGKARNLLGRSYHYILSGMMVAIYGQTDKLMLKQMMNESEVGYYTVATGICAMWVFILTAIIDSIYPTIMQLFSKNHAAFERKNRQLYAIVFYVSGFVSICFLFLGNFVIRILYGASYAGAELPLKIVTWYTAFSYLGVARNAWVVCENKQKYLKYMYLGAAILNVCMNLLFIPRLGAAGAALASLITQIGTSMILPMFIREMRPNVKLMWDAICLRDVF